MFLGRSSAYSYIFRKSPTAYSSTFRGNSIVKSYEFKKRPTVCSCPFEAVAVCQLLLRKSTGYSCLITKITHATSPGRQ
jgi:hypothetical protein